MGHEHFFVLTSTSPQVSLDNVEHKWIPELRHFRRQAPILLVGTKSDLDPATPDESLSAKANDLVDKYGLAGYMECSALLQRGVKAVFDEAILAALDKRDIINAPEKKNKKCNIL